MTTRRTFLASPLLMTACAAVPTTAPVTTAERMQLPGGHAPFDAWLTLPRGYEAEGWYAWPLVVFLHGSGECGQDLKKVAAHGPPKHAAAGREYPFVLCSPQLEEDVSWPPARLHALQAALQQRCRIDANRVLATGLSLGGDGVWDWAAAYPADLAGIAPVCGHGDPAQVCQARPVPVRAYHGAQDDVVPLARQQACVDALRACGGRADFIVYPGVGHGAWDPAYEDPALVTWLMKQDRQQDRQQDRR
jgi:predicted peptidase